MMTEKEQLAEIKSYRKANLSPLRLSTKYLYEPFSPRVHSQVFVNYCEVVIWPDGKVEYAIPSHSEKLYLEYCKKHNIDRDDLWEHFQGENAIDAPDIMMRDMGFVFVWYDHIEHLTKLTDKQLEALQELFKYECINIKLFDNIKLY